MFDGPRLQELLTLAQLVVQADTLFETRFLCQDWQELHDEKAFLFYSSTDSSGFSAGVSILYEIR